MREEDGRELRSSSEKTQIGGEAVF